MADQQDHPKLGHRPSGTEDTEDNPCVLSPAHAQGAALWSTMVKRNGDNNWNAAGIYNPSVGQPDTTLKRKKKKQARAGGGQEEDEVDDDDDDEEEEDDASKDAKARHAAVKKFLDAGSFGLVYNVMFSNPLLKGCPKACWSKSLKPPGWVRTDKAWVTPVHGEGTSKKEQVIMPWKPLSGCQSRLMAMRYLTVVAELTDNDANKLLKEDSPDGHYHTAMRFKTVKPAKVNGGAHSSLKDRVEAFISAEVEPTNGNNTPGALPKLNQVSPKDTMSGDGETRHHWLNRCVSIFKRDFMLQLQVVAVMEGIHLGYPLHKILVWLPPTKTNPVSVVGPLCNSEEEATTFLPSSDVEDVKTLFTKVAHGGNGVATCSRCKCSCAWKGKPLATGFSKCSVTCTGNDGPCAGGCKQAGSDGVGEANLDAAFTVFVDLLRARNCHELYARLTHSSPRTMSRKMGVNWGGVSLAQMQSLLACDDLDWKTGSAAALLATKWRDALVTVGEVGSGLAANKSTKSPLTAANFAPNTAGRSTLKKAIDRYRGATHMDLVLQEKLLATVLARQEESDSAQAGREPQQADYDAVDNDMY